jgi:hypothetical protein
MAQASGNLRCQLREYAKILISDWLTWMSGAIGVGVWVASVFGPGLPAKWLFWAAAIISFFLASFRAWRNERANRPTSEIQILEETETDKNGYFRIRVKNLGNRPVQCGVRLVEMDPPEVPMPIPLQFTHHPEVESINIPPGETQLTDVFCMLPSGDGGIAVLGAKHQQRIEKRPYVFTISAHCPDSSGAQRKFRLSPELTSVSFKAVG